jgi:flagellar biogenesis protein FliO
MWLIANVMKKRGLAPGIRRGPVRGTQVELLARKPLGRNASIAVIRTGGKAMVVGITDHQVTKLDDVDVDEIELDSADGQWTAAQQGPAGLGSAWKTMLEQVRERTVRR